MTLLPLDDWNVQGVEGDSYTVGPYCDYPGCGRPVDHKHHVWRRSYLSGAFWWVRVPTANATTVIRNVVGLCWRHHEDVTGAGGGHAGWIRWDPQAESLSWWEPNPDDKWQKIGTLSLPAPPAEAASSSEGREAERCPTCGRRKPAPDHEHEPGPKRERKSWTIKVPADAEDGAAVLDELVAGCAEVFGHEEYTSALRRYYTVVQALTVVLQNKHRLVAEVDA
jgi:hypothetical protein